MTLLLLACNDAECFAQAEPFAEFPVTSSKKGLQVELVNDAIELGVRHATMNLDLCRMIEPAQETSLKWVSRGENFHFNESYLQRIERDLKRLSGEGTLVYMILLAIKSNPEKSRIMVHPDCANHPPNGIGGFNTATEEGRKWLRATLEFLADRWSRVDEKHGRVIGWIVGNEVNSHWFWYNVGRMEMRQFAETYEKAVRLVCQAVRSESPRGRVYISLEHHWAKRYPAGDAEQCFPARDFLLRFAELARAEDRGGDFEWHVAFHPYPENLFQPAFWKDRSATHQTNTPRVTFKNLQLLPEFLKQEVLLYDGEPRRVILSEQGFHSSGTPESERLQAAAYCYAYRIAAQLDSVDAFILHRHVDHPREGGLQLGIRRRESQKFGDESNVEKDYPRKPIYECMKMADTERWESEFSFALPIIGIDAWPGASK